jgi:hypothetical protein
VRCHYQVNRFRVSNFPVFFTKFSLCILLRPPFTSSLSNISLNSRSPRSPLSTRKQISQPYKTSEITFQYILILISLDRKEKTKNYGPSVSMHSPYFICYYIIHARSFELFAPFPNILNLLHVQKFYWLRLCHDFVLHPEFNHRAFTSFM